MAAALDFFFDQLFEKPTELLPVPDTAVELFRLPDDQENPSIQVDFVPTKLILLNDFKSKLTLFSDPNLLPKYFYIVQIAVGDSKCCVLRRFSQFDALRSRLRHTFPDQFGEFS